MKNFFNSKFPGFLKNRFFISHNNFVRDWIFLVVVSMVLFIILIAISFWLNISLIKKQEESIVIHRNVISLNRETLSNMVNFYKTQEKDFNIAKDSYAKYRDPSR